jgi:hypothetical protein
LSFISYAVAINSVAIKLEKPRMNNFNSWELGNFEVARSSKWCRLPIFLLYNPFLQTNGITLDPDPSPPKPK